MKFMGVWSPLSNLVRMESLNEFAKNDNLKICGVPHKSKFWISFLRHFAYFARESAGAIFLTGKTISTDDLSHQPKHLHDTSRAPKYRILKIMLPTAKNGTGL